jgi:hypothetical protein
MDVPGVAVLRPDIGVTVVRPRMDGAEVGGKDGPGTVREGNGTTMAGSVMVRGEDGRYRMGGIDDSAVLPVAGSGGSNA